MSSVPARVALRLVPGPRGARGWLLVLVAVLLAGCVEYRESLVIERNGAGTATLEVGVSETLARAAELAERNGFEREPVVASIEAVDGLHVEESSLDSRGGARWLRVRVRFDSVASLARLDSASGYQGLFGSVSLADAGERDLRLTRSPALDRERAGALRLVPALLGPVLSRYRWHFEAHLPTRVSDARGPGATLADSRRTVTWEFGLADVLASPQRLEATYARPGAGPLALAAGAALMLAGAAVALALVRRRRAADRPPV